MSGTVSYRQKYNAVEISGWIGGKFVIDVPNIKSAIRSIEANRATFATEEAYQRALSVYTGALDYAKNIGLDKEA